MGSRLRIVVGLGNPGKKYEKNRHNIGAILLEDLAREWGWSFKGLFTLYRQAKGLYEGQEVMLVRSKTYMNDTGRAVTGLLARTRYEPADLMVVYDDWNLPLGAVRFRASGSAGGHKGLSSIIGALGTDQVPRCRIGIGSPASRGGQAGTEDPAPSSLTPTDFVLSDFSRQEKEALEPALERAREGVKSWITSGIDAAMNKYNSNPGH